ncbi:hypothetical protein C0992_007991 [Termitomyces sp. T32_za158]|nr:hypothetical protein C0992_007991 [Termitomyces sp. T32_za158]
MAANSNSSKVSRFSTTLKAFKFNNNSDKPPTPPPKDGSCYNLNINRSFVSLAPESSLSLMNRFMGLPPTWTANLANAGFSEEEIIDIQNRRQAARSPGPHYLYLNRPASPAYSPRVPVLAHSRMTSPQHGQVPDTPSPPSIHPPIPSVASPIDTPRMFPPQRQAQFDNHHIHNYNHHPTSSIGSLATSVLSHATTTSVTSFVQEAPSFAGSASIRGPSPQPLQQSSVSPRWPFQIINELPSPPPSYNVLGASYPNSSAEKSQMRNVTPPSTRALLTPDVTPSDAHLLNTSLTIPLSPPSHQQVHTVSITTTSPATTPSPTSTTSTHDTSTLGTSTPDTPLTRPPSTSSTSSSSASTDTDTDTDTLCKRLTALPPRLSLHKSKDSTDLTSWGEALLSGISTASGGGSARGVGNILETAQEAGFGLGLGWGLGAGVVSSRAVANGRGKEEEPMTNRDYYKRAIEQRRASQVQGQRKGASLVPPLNVNVRSTNSSNGFDDDDEEEEEWVDTRKGGVGEDGPSSSVAQPAVTARYDPNATSWDEDGYVAGKDGPEEREGTNVNGRGVRREMRDEEDEEEEEEEECVGEGDYGAPRASPLWKDIEGLLRPGNLNSRSTAHRPLDDTLSVPSPGTEPSHEEDVGERGKRESSRSSTSTVLAEAATISVARSVSVVRKVGRYVVGRSPVVERRDEPQDEDGWGVGQAHLLSQSQSQSQLRTQIHHHSPPRVQFQSGYKPPPKPTRPAPPPPPSSSSPLSSSSGSGSGSGSGSRSGSTSASSSENENEDSTPATEDVDEDDDMKALEYYHGRRTPDTSRTFLPVHPQLQMKEREVVSDDAHPVEETEELQEEELDHTTDRAQGIKVPTRPGIVIVQEDVPSTSSKLPQLHPPSNSLPIPSLALAPVPTPTSATSFVTTTPLSPFHRYPGWLSAIVRPLEEYIDDSIDPREYYLDLQEIAEGDSGSVFAARLTPTPSIANLWLPPRIKARDAEDLANRCTTVVAIKSVAILPTGSPKLVDLEKELRIMRKLMGEGGGQGQGHDNVLGMEAVYVDLVEDALWIRMELMERSLADIVGLVPSGLILGDRTVARFASDVLQALEFLQHHRIAHRDVRSDNLLVNSQGVLKLRLIWSSLAIADFSNAVQLPNESSMSSDLVGVAYWQAPEMRSYVVPTLPIQLDRPNMLPCRPPYDALKVDVWSLGATVWEMAEAEPPFAKTQQFSDRWPTLSRPHLFSPVYHEFLRLCSQPSSTRPSPSELTKCLSLSQHPFINNACGRQVIIQLISRCVTIEQALLEGDVSRGFLQE